MEPPNHPLARTAADLDSLPEDLRKLMATETAALADTPAARALAGTFQQLTGGSASLGACGNASAGQPNELAGRTMGAIAQRLRQEAKKLPLMPPPREELLPVNPPHWLRQEEEARQREREKLDLMRRSTAASEQALADSRQRERIAIEEKGEAERRERDARGEARRWKIITALMGLASLALSAWTILKDSIGR